MSYQALINRNLDKAFRLLKDIAIDITLNRNTADFDFSSNATNVTANSSVSLKAVVTDINKESPEYNYLEKQVLFKSKDIDDLTVYDTITIEAETWKIGSKINNSGYIYLLNIFKDK